MDESLDDDIRATVDRAISTGDLLEIPDEAKRIAAAHPEAAAGEIAELLLKAGVSARVPLAWNGVRD